MAYPRQNTKTATATATNATATATLASPGSEQRWRITVIHASVSAGTATLTVSSGGTTLLTASVTAGSPLTLSVPDGIQALLAGDAISAALSAAGASNVGNVFLCAVREG